MAEIDYSNPRYLLDGEDLDENERLRYNLIMMITAKLVDAGLQVSEIGLYNGMKKHFKPLDIFAHANPVQLVDCMLGDLSWDDYNFGAPESIFVMSAKPTEEISPQKISP